MIKKCEGCGAVLQIDSNNKEGYIKAELYDTNNICERCFKIKNYGQYQKLVKSNQDFLPILENINQKDDLVVLVVDIFHIPKEIYSLGKYLNNKVLLVFTKRDILPLSVSDEKLISYGKNIPLNIIDTVLISSFKNYHFDELYEKILRYKTSKKIYIVGYTNAGKSTMINKLLYNYYDKCREVTTSMLPSTTLNTIEIELDDLTIIDTPGILDTGNIVDIVDIKTLKKIIPKKEIKPVTYQLKKEQTIFIEDMVRIDNYNDGSITLYISNALKVERTFKKNDKLKNLEVHHIEVSENEDIVIAGLGFIKCVSPGRYDIYTYKNVQVFTRSNLI